MEEAVGGVIVIMETLQFLHLKSDPGVNFEIPRLPGSVWIHNKFFEGLPNKKTVNAWHTAKKMSPL